MQLERRRFFRRGFLPEPDLGRPDQRRRRFAIGREGLTKTDNDKADFYVGYQIAVNQQQ